MKRPLSWVGVVCLLTLAVQAITGGWVERVSARSGPPLPGFRAVVVDERYSPLRERPDLQSGLVQRLRRGRVVGLLGSVRNRRGERFHRIAISRKRTGWIHELALVRRGNRADGARLLTLIEQASDDYARVGLARIGQREFRGTTIGVAATQELQVTGERIARRLTTEIRRRLGDVSSADRRALFLSHAGLDRYSRLGMVFDYDPVGDQLIISGFRNP
ncbi:MAG: hypothetical protein ACKOB4_17605 [Acidobacteriota bacterium]